MTPHEFVDKLSEWEMPWVFNPWRDWCDIHDRTNAVEIRCQNLTRFLESAMDNRVQTIWIARDLGYRGGRRTGIPLTDEKHLHQACKIMRMEEDNLNRSTLGEPMVERTATTIWQVLEEIDEPTMLWNIFPFHPYENKGTMTNRCHTKAERESTRHILDSLIGMLRPRRLIALGRDAQKALESLDNVSVCPVRHPSYGGQSDFIAGIYEIYGIGTSIEPPMDVAPPLADDWLARPQSTNS